MEDIAKQIDELVKQAKTAYQFNPSSYSFAALNEAIKLQHNSFIKQRASY